MVEPIKLTRRGCGLLNSSNTLICATGDNESVLAGDEQEAWAKWIEHCVNHHHALVEALKLILPMAKGYAILRPLGSNAAYAGQAEIVLAEAQRIHSDLPEKETSHG